MTQLYQDIWVKGKVTAKGARECAERYEVVRSHCEKYKRPFTVLDVGAADGYFAVRLTEDFPECTVVAIEPRARIGEILKRNDQPRVLWLKKGITVEELHMLAEVEHFDTTLALSVIHWLKVPPAWSIGVLRELGDYLILELPVEKTATGQQVVEAIELPPGGTLIGHGKSHLDAGAKRPIYRYGKAKTGLAKYYWGETHQPKNVITIKSSFAKKTFFKGKKVSRPWHRGINLQTFLALNGALPTRKRIVEMVRFHWDSTWGPGSPHGDIMPWNVILQGDRAVLIDEKPKGKRSWDDAGYLDRLCATVMRND